MNWNRNWLWIAFLADLCYVGVPFWRVPYQKVSLPDTLEGSGMLVVALSAFLLCLFHLAGFKKVLLATGAAMPAAVLLRVQVEVARDPTSHNLWPFEIVIAAGLGLICALAGAVPGRLAGATLGGRPAKGAE